MNFVILSKKVEIILLQNLKICDIYNTNLNLSNLFKDNSSKKIKIKKHRRQNAINSKKYGFTWTRRLFGLCAS